MTRLLGFAAALSLALSGCAAMLTGTADDVTVNSEPPGAQCRIERMAQPVAYIASTPATVRIVRSRYPIDIACTKEGLTGAESVVPGVNPWAYGDLAFGGVPYIPDSIVDADRNLPSEVLVRFPMQR